MDFRRLLAFFAGISLTAAACGAAPLEPEETLPPATTSTTTTAERPTLDPAARVALAADTITDLDTFRFHVRVEATVDSEEEGFDGFEFEASGVIDVANDRSRIRLDYGEQFFANEQEELPTYSEEIRIGEELYQRGFNSVTILAPDVDYDAWYRGTDSDIDADGLLIGLVDGAAISALLDAADEVVHAGVEEMNGVTVTHLETTITRSRLSRVGAAHPDSIVDLDLLEEGPPARFEMWIDDGGLTHRLMFDVDEPFDGMTNYSAEIELSGFGEPVEIVAPDEVLDPPDYLDDLVSGDVRTAIRPQDDGTMFRLSVRNTNDDLQLTVERNGRVVAITDTSILATPDDYTTWQITETAVGTLVSLIEESGLLGHPKANLQFGGDRDGTLPSAGLFYNDCCVIEMNGLGDRDGFTEQELTSRLAFEELIGQLRDMAWLGDEVLTEPVPFVPEGVTLLAEPSQGGRQPVLDWPLPLGVRALGGEPTGEIGWSGSPICLYGDDAAAVFALTAPSGGTNLTVDDGEEVWDLLLRPHVPGYRLQGDPCE